MVLQQSLFSDEEIGGISLEDVFEAYFECRKRNVTPAMPLPSRANTNASVWSYGGKSIPALTILRVPSLSSLTSL